MQERYAGLLAAMDDIAAAGRSDQVGVGAVVPVRAACVSWQLGPASGSLGRAWSARSSASPCRSTPPPATARRTAPAGQRGAVPGRRAPGLHHQLAGAGGLHRAAAALRPARFPWPAACQAVSAEQPREVEAAFNASATLRAPTGLATGRPLASSVAGGGGGRAQRDPPRRTLLRRIIPPAHAHCPQEEEEAAFNAIRHTVDELGEGEEAAELIARSYRGVRAGQHPSRLPWLAEGGLGRGRVGACCTQLLQAAP